MRIIAILMILGVSACSVTKNTDRHSGAGIVNQSVPVAEATAPPAGETDYRGKLMEEIGES